MSELYHEYVFPEKDPFRATEVTEPEFDILATQAYYDQLYVDFSPIRKQTHFDEMKFLLGMQGKQLVSMPNTFRKIIFSGHRGCGKSIELQRFKHQVDNPNAYLTLFINLEEETEIQRFEPEDLYVILISVLLRELSKRNVPIAHDYFQDIGDEWLQESELRNELSKEYGMKTEGGANLGWTFWETLGVQGNFKKIYARNNKTTQIIRQKIKLNQRELIFQLNQAFAQLRTVMQQTEGQPYGKDILIIIDGLEKTNLSVHETLFLRDVQLIYGLDIHLISCVPIQTFYKAATLATSGFFERIYLPMIRVNADTIDTLKQIITKRVDPSLFAAGIIDQIVQKSGGCPRQLLHLAHRAIVNALGKTVTQETADKTYQRLGNERWLTLTKEDKRLIREGKFDDAEPAILNLLFTLNLLEYNGAKSERKLNPLLRPFFEASFS